MSHFLITQYILTKASAKNSPKILMRNLSRQVGMVHMAGLNKEIATADST